MPSVREGRVLNDVCKLVMYSERIRKLESYRKYRCDVTRLCLEVRNCIRNAVNVRIAGRETKAVFSQSVRISCNHASNRTDSWPNCIRCSTFLSISLKRDTR